MNKGIQINIIDREYCGEYVIGMIVIDDFQEIIEIPIEYWKLDQYEYQWKNGLQRLKDYNNSCLVFAVNDPHQRRYVNWWLLYKENGLVYIQNQIIIGEIYKEMIGKKDFTVETCYDFIPDRYCSDDEDEKVSEWCVRYSDIF